MRRRAGTTGTLGVMARPRDPEVDVRILQVVRELIESAGAAEVTIEAVAERAGVSRPTVYRRWATRAELLFAAETNATVAVEFPDTGSLRGDLVVAVDHLAGTMAGSNRSVAAEHLGRMIADASFAQQVWAQRWIPDRDAVYQLWERALQRGEVAPHTDGVAVIDDLVGVCLFRVYLGHQALQPADVASIVDRVLDGVLIDTPQP